MSGPLELTVPGRTLRQALRRGFAVVMVLVGAVGLAGGLGVAIATQRVEHLSTVLTPAVEANAAALRLMLDAETGVRGYLLTGDPTFLEPYTEARDEAVQALRDTRRLGEAGGVDAPYDEELQAARRWLDDYAEPAVGAPGVASATDPETGKALFDDFRAEQREVGAALAERREQVRADARRYRAVVVPGMAALTLLALVFVALVTRGTVRVVTGPLDRVRGVLDRLRLGEHDARAAVVGPAELRDVAASVNALADESDVLRARQAELADLRQRTRDAVRLVRDELGRAAVLQVAARALADVGRADAAVVRYLGRGERSAEHDDVPDGAWGTQAAPAALHRARTADELALARSLVRASEVLLLPDVGAVPDDGSAPLEHLAARLVREVTPTAVSAAVAVAAVSGEPSALAVLAFDGPRSLSEDEAQSLQRLCDDLGQSLEQSDLFERQLRLVDRLQELDRQKTVFLSNVSHELRTPLTSITGYTEMLLDGDAGPLAAPATRMVEVVDRSAHRLRELIEDLLSLSRMESGAHRGRREAVDVGAVTRAATATLEPQARAGGVRLETRIDADAPRIMGDAGQLERVVLNLAGNAVKFTPEGGSVEVVVGRHPEGVRLVVRDTGIGIPVEEQESLFERFFRASNAVAGAVPGTGLGLSIVRGVVEAHAGTLVVRSVPGEGTEVEVLLRGAPPDAR